MSDSLKTVGHSCDSSSVNGQWHLEFSELEIKGSDHLGDEGVHPRTT